MKFIATLAGSGLLLLGTGVAAQDAAVPAPDPAPHAGHAPADGSSPTTPAAPFTDAEVESFARAALAIQELDTSDPAAMQQQATRIAAEAGIDVSTYNAIGQAMRTDTALAARVQAAARAQAPSAPAG